MSKGSSPRPYSVGLDQFANNWDAIFKKDNDVTPRTETMKTGTCGCGRSPTGNCIGWHSLTESAYQAAKITWEAAQKEKEQAK
jgi:hypothetical protein